MAYALDIWAPVDVAQAAISKPESGSSNVAVKTAREEATCAPP
ncbi:MAG: hypothetical protein JWQ17_2717, partial [Tardiphaga sp.]|nr:hypothetical protein [Tardiphaga sp.]